MQVPLHDWRHPHEIADVPQLLLTQSANSAPPTRTTQTCPAAHIVEEAGLGQVTAVHALVVTCHLGDDTLPATQVATVRPAPAQSS